MMKNKVDNKKRNFLIYSEIELFFKVVNIGFYVVCNYCLILFCFIYGFWVSEIC